MATLIITVVIILALLGLLLKRLVASVFRNLFEFMYKKEAEDKNIDNEFCSPPDTIEEDDD